MSKGLVDVIAPIDFLLRERSALSKRMCRPPGTRTSRGCCRHQRSTTHRLAWIAGAAPRPRARERESEYAASHTHTHTHKKKTHIDRYMANNPMYVLDMNNRIAANAESRLKLVAEFDESEQYPETCTERYYWRQSPIPEPMKLRDRYGSHLRAFTNPDATRPDPLLRQRQNAQSGTRKKMLVMPNDD